ncbi:MAG: type II toxin-antitoxin system HicB family antitoxin [Pseudomonadota bacterium]
MRSFTAVIERCPDTNLYVGFIPGFPGAHSQGETLDELNKNLKEVVEMLLEDGDFKLLTLLVYFGGVIFSGYYQFTHLLPLVAH